MPSLMRFLTVIGLIVGAGFVSLLALATFVTPNTREMTVTIPAQRLKPPAAEAARTNPQTAGADSGSATATTR